MAKFEPRPFGKYFLTDLIAIGGMAEIFKAKTFGVDGFEKVLAIKKILPHYSADKEFITMLTDEAKLVVNLSHANIVQVYDLGRVDNDYFISMEFIDGINLRDVIEKAKLLGEPVPPEISIYIASEVCKGLDYAHNKKDENGNPLHIVHRDISPQNILCSYDGAIKIVDFGIAKAARNLSQTNIGILKGKVTYMAPEQAFGKPIDGRTDIFSLGIVLYELLTLKRLFTGESQMEVLKKIRNSQITEDSFGDDIPAALKRVLAKALSYSVKNRYQSAADLQVDLTRILYSHYSDFSPRKLCVLMQLWFQNEINRNGKEAVEVVKEPQETILVRSSTHQIDIVHHEDTEGSLEAGGESDTIHPEDNVTSERFRERAESVLEATEETEKSELTVSSETVEDMLKRKKRRSLSRGLLTVFGILVLVGGFAWFKSSATWDRWFNSDSSQGQQGQVPGDEKKFIELKIVTRPSEALVTLNGEDLEDKTPVTLEELEVGTTVALKISKEGFEPIEQTVTLEKDMSDELTFDLKELPPVVYLLSLESTPSGAQVFIDGQPTDHVTPTTLDPIEPGKTLKIGLKLDKYKTYEQDFVAQGDLEQKLTASLEPIPFAKAVITSTPSGAAIFVNDLSLNHTTPYTLENLELPQRLFVRLEKDGYEKFEKTIEVTEARDFLVEGRLDKKPPPVVEVPVRITANIAGAQIFINGEERGVTPLKLSLVPGDYQVMVSKAQYKSLSKTVTVKAGSKQRDAYFQINPIVDETPPINTTNNNNLNNTSNNNTHNNNTTVIGHPGDIENTNSQSQTTGRLRVDSSPRGASVKVNGAPAGVTPIVVGDLPKNRPVSVQVSKSGYRSWQSTVTLVKDYTEMNAVLTQ